MRALYFWLVLVIVIQPALSQIDYVRNLAVKGSASYLAERAAPAGRLTPDLIAEVKSKLEAIGLENVTIDGTTDVQPRGGTIQVTVTASRTPSIALKITSREEERYYRAQSQIMSEFVPVGP